MIDKAISLLRPGVTFGPSGSCSLLQSGGTVTIERWADPRPKPTASEIAAAIPQAEQQALLATFDAALTAHLDKTAQEQRYDNRITCALRAGFDGPFKAEGVAFAQWMDNCNAYAYQVMADVQAGRRAQPTLDQFIGELPILTWPT